MVADAAGAEGGADGWSAVLTDAVAKSGRDSDRRLFMYGISSNRCPKCQARLKNDSIACGSCHYTHKAPRKCTRCSQKNDPVMWCADCDAYFCANCHKKPHVLMLGSSKPHHCFVIDGASGKHFVDSAWSDAFAAMVQATYRLRLHDKMLADEEAAKAPATTHQPAASTAGGTKPSGPVSSLPTRPQQPSEGASTSTDSRPISIGTSVSVSTAVSPASTSTTPLTGQSSSGTSPQTQEPSRKRQLPGPDDTRDRAQKSIRPDETSRTGRAAAAAPSDGMRLYDRVKALHDKRTRSTQSKSPQAVSPKMGLAHLLSQRKEEQIQQQGQQQGSQAETEPKAQLNQQRQQEEEQTERMRKEQQKLEEDRANQLRNEQQRLNLEQAERLRMKQQQQEEQQRLDEQRRLDGLRDNLRHQEEQRRQEQQRRHEALLQQGEQRRQSELRWQEEQRQQAELRRQQEELQRHQRLMDERVRHEQILREQEEERRRQHQAETHVLMHEGNRFISQAQQVLHTQPGYIVTSMAEPTISAPMQQTSGIRATRIPSPVSSVSPHGQHFQAVSSGFMAAANTHGAQVFQSQAPVMESRFETVQEHEGNHHLVVRNPNIQRQPNEQQQTSDAMVPHRGAGAVFSSRTVGEDDELRAIWVSDYDNVNALVMQLELEIANKTEEGRAFVHRSNTITIPEQLKLQINSLHTQREQAMTKRFQSVVRVLIFSEAVRTFAQQNEHTNIWNDIPAVLESSHKKCAELAADVRAFELRAQKLREGIDEAVSSGNPEKMQNVAHLGSLIADLEHKIRVSNAERDKKFLYMFQFSSSLRNMVRAEWAIPGRNQLR